MVRSRRHVATRSGSTASSDVDRQAHFNDAGIIVYRDHKLQRGYDHDDDDAQQQQQSHDQLRHHHSNSTTTTTTTGNNSTNSTSSSALPSSAKPLSIDNDYRDDHYKHDDDIIEDDYSTIDDIDHHPPPAYTPRLFRTHPHLAVLPVLLLEFLSLAVTRAVLPSLLLKRYGHRTYIVMGVAECIRGILAFFACPLFGKLSDAKGRRVCLLITVLGTLSPVCSLAFWRVDDYDGYGYEYAADAAAVGDDVMGEAVGATAKTILDEIEETALLNGVDAGEASDGIGSWWNPAFVASADDDDRDERILPFLMMDYFELLPTVHRIDVFVALLALSGLFSSTFTLTFAYISDVVKDRDGRVGAYGLALATFGLSFTIGPLLGGYLANVVVEEEENGNGVTKMFHMDNETDNEGSDSSFAAGGGGGNGGQHDHRPHYGSNNSDIHPLGQHRVFVTSLILAVLDLFYIHFFLPESLNRGVGSRSSSSGKRREESSSEHDGLVDASVVDGRTMDDAEDESDTNADDDAPSSNDVARTSATSNAPHPAGAGISRRASSSWWNPFDSVRYLMTDPLLSTIGRVTFFYYTALHAVVSTLILYAARQFHLNPQRLGELMAALGLSTMISEAVLVRLLIPLLGETRCMRIGLISFALQCVLLAVADSPWHLFACAFLAMAGNLVYPSVSSLVSSTVRPEMVGRALGAVNGVKSLTEGVGPLVFGTLLTMSEKDKFPGWPYFLAAIMVAFAYQACRALPDDCENYTSDFYIQTTPTRNGHHKVVTSMSEEESCSLLDNSEEADTDGR